MSRPYTWIKSVTDTLSVDIQIDETSVISTCVDLQEQKTPLFLAVEVDHLDMVKLLIDLGAMVDARCSVRESCFQSDMH